MSAGYLDTPSDGYWVVLMVDGTVEQMAASTDTAKVAHWVETTGTLKVVHLVARWDVVLE
jgi:microcompartment protein CcmL/EutN